MVAVALRMVAVALRVVAVALRMVALALRMVAVEFGFTTLRLRYAQPRMGGDVVPEHEPQDRHRCAAEREHSNPHTSVANT
eukprot:357793-Chlamydomonas_euryale.AAC.3